MVDTYNYSLVRAVPDPRRGEWVNVGVVVYLRDGLDVRLLDHFGKLRMLAPDLDLSVLRQLPEGWNRLCAGIDDPRDRQLLLSRLPLAHASQIAQFIAGEHDYERQLKSIMRDLVIPPAALREQNAPTRLESELRSHFRQSKLLGSKPADIERHLVVNRFPIDRAAGLYADFALRNGAMRITETIDFRVKPEQIRANRRGLAALKAVTLNRAAEHFKDGCVPSVVYAADVKTLDLIQPSLALLGGYAERLYDATNPHDMADYMTMMHRAATAA